MIFHSRKPFSCCEIQHSCSQRSNRSELGNRACLPLVRPLPQDFYCWCQTLKKPQLRFFFAVATTRVSRAPVRRLAAGRPVLVRPQLVSATIWRTWIKRDAPLVLPNWTGRCTRQVRSLLISTDLLSLVCSRLSFRKVYNFILLDKRSWRNSIEVIALYL